MSDFLTQREVANLLRVSVSYIRASSCPKVFLPSLKPGGRALVRYERLAVEQWIQERQTRALTRNAS